MRHGARTFGVWSADKQRMLAHAETYRGAVGQAMRLRDDSVEVGRTCPQHPDRIVTDCTEEHR